MSRVWFHRARAVTWLVLGLVAWLAGWADSVVLVWWASVYANAVSDWGAAEAADDKKVLDRLDRIEGRLAGSCPTCAGGLADVDTVELWVSEPPWWTRPGP